jgi:hypothetical protein
MKQRNLENAVIADAENTSGEHPVGRVVHLSTVTHAWRGKLEAVTASYYIFEPGAELILSTGEIGAYGTSETSRPVEGEKCPARVRVLRGAVAWLIEY